MKLLLLHGPGKTGSRKKLIEIKQKFDPSDVVIFEEGSSSKNIADNLVATSLFNDERLVVLENPDDVDFLPTTRFAARRANYQLPITLLLWFDHEISEKKPIMEWVKKKGGQIMFFPESKEISVFPFLDFLAAKDKKAFLEMDKLKKVGLDTQYLITMTFYLLRNLVATPKNAPEFVKKKLVKQRAKFDLEDIKSFYKNILGIDFKLKSGLLEKEQAEFLLVNLFTHQV